MALDVLESRDPVPGKGQLGVIHHVEDDHFVLVVAEMLQSAADPGLVVDQVADHDHQPAPLEPLGDRVQDRADVGVVARRRVVEHVEHLAELRRPGSRRQRGPNLAVEENQPHGVVLAQHQMG